MTYDQDSSNQIISTAEHRDSLAIYQSSKESIDTKLENLLEYVFGELEVE